MEVLKNWNSNVGSYTLEWAVSLRKWKIQDHKMDVITWTFHFILINIKRINDLLLQWDLPQF